MGYLTLISKLFARQVGVDDYGNTYYESRDIWPNASQRKKRWVVYKGEQEASKVPSSWHNWLHYNTDMLPQGEAKAFNWQKPHQPNLTGSSKAYKPRGALDLSGNEQEKDAYNKKFYHAWTPKEESHK